jgi:hypothetical protein
LGEKIETLSRFRYNLGSVIVPFKFVRNAQTKDFRTVDHFQECPFTVIGSIVVADQVYRRPFLFASKKTNKNIDFATLFLVLQQREDKRKPTDVNVNKR